MASRWVFLILLFLILIEIVHLEIYDEIPLSKSLGFSLKDGTMLDLDDEEFRSRRYKEMYEDMMNASRESFERMGEEDARLESIAGSQTGTVMKRGVTDQRRTADLSSPVRRRRARSQSTRREKLNSQGLRNHQRHIRLLEKEILDS